MNQPTKAEQEAKARREQQIAEHNKTTAAAADANEQQRQRLLAAGATGATGPAMPAATADPAAADLGIRRTEAQIAATKAAYEADLAASAAAAEAHHENEEAARTADTEKNEREHEAAKLNVDAALASGQVPPQNPAVQAALSKLNQPIVGPMTAEQAYPDEDVVQMMIPLKGITLTTDKGQKVRFPGGIQNVPVSLQDHWYMRAHGVKPFKGPSPAPKAKTAVATHG